MFFFCYQDREIINTATELMWPKGKKRVVQEVDGVATDDIAEKRMKSDLPIFKEPLSGVILHQTGDV